MKTRRRTREPYWKNYKLYPEEVVEIYFMANAGMNQREIATYFGISASHVSNIGAARFWVELLMRY